MNMIEQLLQLSDKLDQQGRPEISAKLDRAAQRLIQISKKAQRWEKLAQTDPRFQEAYRLEIREALADLDPEHLRKDAQLWDAIQGLWTGLTSTWRNAQPEQEYEQFRAQVSNFAEDQLTDFYNRAQEIERQAETKELPLDQIEQTVDTLQTDLTTSVQQMKVTTQDAISNAQDELHPNNDFAPLVMEILNEMEPWVRDSDFQLPQVSPALQEVNNRIVDAHTLAVQQYQQKMKAYKKQLFQSQGPTL